VGSPPMQPPIDDLGTERDQTDKSLRIERAKTDDTREETVSTIDALADAVINRARAKADALLAAARAKADRQSVVPAPSAVLAGERGREDTAVHEERTRADEALRDERIKKADQLVIERAETDKDLLVERTQADVSVATRDDFLGVVSHDLRNMLATVISFTELIDTAVARDDHVGEVRDHTRRILRAAGRMDRLIGDLVDLASIEAGRLAVHPELGDPRQVVAEAVDAFQVQAASAGIAISAEFAGVIPRVPFDPSRILQVLTNLLSNAIKFTPAGGRVTLRVEGVGAALQFAVRDTGVGIPGDKLAAIFERFLQLPDRQRQGHGLGLYISRCIVEGHGGRIWAESTPGHGSRFCVLLPRPDPAAALH
jgi:signal transduction histidine kinase